VASVLVQQSFEIMSAKKQITENGKASLLFSPSAAYEDVDAKWNTMFQRLIQYQQQNGNCLVPSRYDQDLKLGHWVAAQREARTKINSTKKNLLDSINFVWSIRGKYDRSSWDDVFDRLVKYKRHHGNCKVPQRYKEDPKLGSWVDWQRRLHERHKLSNDKKQRLEEIGFTWTRRKRQSWDTMFERLVEYKKCHGHASVEQKEKEDPQLGVWVKTQRQNRYNMSATRRQKLDSIGFWWTVKTINLEDNMEERDPAQQKQTRQKPRKLQIDIGGETDSSNKNNSDGVDDGVPHKSNQNQNQEDCDKMNEKERTKQSAGIKKPEMSQEERWTNMLEKLMQYKMDHGNCLVPKLYLPDPKLGRWVDNQRCRREEMPDARRNLLDDIGFVWKLMPNEDWDVMFDRLLRFKSQHGHTVVPTRYNDDPQLGQWVKNQQRDKLKMLQERKQRLEDSGFVWTVPKGWNPPRITEVTHNIGSSASKSQDESFIKNLQGNNGVNRQSAFRSLEASLVEPCRRNSEMRPLVWEAAPQPNNSTRHTNISTISEKDRMIATAMIGMAGRTQSPPTGHGSDSSGPKRVAAFAMMFQQQQGGDTKKKRQKTSLCNIREVPTFDIADVPPNV